MDAHPLLCGVAKGSVYYGDDVHNACRHSCLQPILVPFISDLQALLTKAAATCISRSTLWGVLHAIFCPSTITEFVVTKPPHMA